MRTLLLIAAIFAFYLIPRPAPAACSADVRSAVKSGLHFLRDGQAYERKNEKELAAADFENMGHQLELVRDEMQGCSDQRVNLDFMMLSAYDDWYTYLGRSNEWSDDLKQKHAKNFRMMVWTFYESDGNKAYPNDYVELKASVKALYQEAGLTYCSPEKSDCPM